MRVAIDSNQQTYSKKIFIKKTIIISQISKNKRLMALKDDKDKVYIWYEKIIKKFQFPQKFKNIKFSNDSEYIYGFAENNIYQLSIVSGFNQLLTFQLNQDITLSINSLYQFRYIIQILDHQQFLVLYMRQMVKYDFIKLFHKKIKFEQDIIQFDYLIDHDIIACLSAEVIYISKNDSIIIKQKRIKNVRTRYINPYYTQIKFLRINYFIILINGCIVVYKINYDQNQIQEINSFYVNTDCILKFNFDQRNQYLIFYGFKVQYYLSTKNIHVFDEFVDLIEIQNNKESQIKDFKIVDWGKNIQSIIVDWGKNIQSIIYIIRFNL